jgi:8-oxo-dGTP pyrophosphatase MutT (NUDIX family)
MDLSAVADHVHAAITDERYDAAVLIPVLDRPDGDYVVFTKRADDLDEHPGQMSFPGGGRESEDEDLSATALREANEEIGLLAEETDPVGRLDDIRTITEYSVTPFVARVPDRKYDPDDREVAEVVVLPVAGLTDPENHEHERREHPHYGEIVIHYFHVDDYTVWGATGRILVQLLELTTEWRAPVKSSTDVG